MPIPWRASAGLTADFRPTATAVVKRAVGPTSSRVRREPPKFEVKALVVPSFRLPAFGLATEAVSPGYGAYFPRLRRETPSAKEVFARRC